MREEILKGEAITQFGWAMKELYIEIICANTPQDKGRVERALKDSVRSSSAASHSLLSRALVVLQVALSVLLLVGAGPFFLQ